MIVLLLVLAAIAGGLGLVYRFRENLRRLESPAAPAPSVRGAGPPPADDVIDTALVWTALDDHQLNRLLRESS